MLRKSAFAGFFYPAQKEQLSAILDQAFPDYALADRPSLVMVPHAGFVFSVATAAEALSGVHLPDTVIILCPSHTGLGSQLGVWPGDAWLTPLGSVNIDKDLGEELCRNGIFEKDYQCHLREHAIEVVLPLLQFMRSGNPPLIVPVCVGTNDPATLKLAAASLADAAGEGIQSGSVLLIVSSDMNHYEDEETTIRKDRRALECVLAEDGEALLARCAAEHITMCGAAPMALALMTLEKIRNGKRPALPARLTGHTTSGAVNNDYEHVVGYAGVRIYC